MIIPIRVPADAQPVTNGGTWQMNPKHQLAADPCPVCHEALVTAPITLVYLGIRPGERKASGWMNGMSVPVHALCALGPDHTQAEE